MDQLDAYELRVKLYAMGWDKSHFVHFSESLLRLCRLESRDQQGQYSGAYAEIQLDRAGFIKPGAVFFFKHDSQSCPTLKDAFETHLLSAADGTQSEKSMDPYYDIPGFPWGITVLAPCDSQEEEQQFYFQRQYKVVSVNGYPHPAKTLLEAIALSAYISLPYRTLDDLERISRLSLSGIANSYQKFKEGLIAEDPSCP